MNLQIISNASSIDTLMNLTALAGNKKMVDLHICARVQSTRLHVIS